jgi:outer membrane protein TolC
LTPDDCVRIALRQSAGIAQAEAKVRLVKARLAEVEANYGPQLQALTWLAPMFTVRGDAFSPTVDRAYGWRDWGPYAHLEARLALPLYTFGRIEAGEIAARAQVRIAKARVQLAHAAIATEVRTLYHLHLFALSMRPTLDLARRMVADALTQAEAMYAAGKGITQVDLGRLRYGEAEVIRLTRVADDGAALALEALKHAMGVPRATTLRLAWTRLPRPEGEVPPLTEVLRIASGERPEWRMLADGEMAALSLEDAEQLANAPTVFIAGTFNADWAPTRDGSDNPYHNDPFNRINGGVAVGMNWDFQPARASARAEGARARGAEVTALRAFARTGIPLEVVRAHQTLTREQALVETSRAAVKATRKWVTFAGSAWQTGTGEARDILEGLVALLGAKRTYYNHLRGYHDAQADLTRATGRVHPQGEPQ